MNDAPIETALSRQAQDFSWTVDAFVHRTDGVTDAIVVSADGLPIANARVGISTVPPELIRDMMPPGLSQVEATITIQAPGVARFSTPIQLKFPNVYGVAPGEKVDFNTLNNQVVVQYHDSEWRRFAR